VINLLVSLSKKIGKYVTNDPYDEVGTTFKVYLIKVILKLHFVFLKHEKQCFEYLCLTDKIKDT